MSVDDHLEQNTETPLLLTVGESSSRSTSSVLGPVLFRVSTPFLQLRGEENLLYRNATIVFNTTGSGSGSVMGLNWTDNQSDQVVENLSETERKKSNNFIKYGC